MKIINMKIRLLKQWFKEMKPRFKNCRWWLVLPLVLALLLVLKTLKVTIKVLDYTTDLIEECAEYNPLLSRVVGWVESNNKIK